jgi:hypothetical protein
MNEDDGRCLLSLYEHSRKPVAGSHLLFPFSTTKAPGERVLKLRSVFICISVDYVMFSSLQCVYISHLPYYLSWVQNLIVKPFSFNKT